MLWLVVIQFGPGKYPSGMSMTCFPLVTLMKPNPMRMGMASIETAPGACVLLVRLN